MTQSHPVSLLGTHEVFNQPQPRGGRDLWATDRALRDHARASGAREQALARAGVRLGAADMVQAGEDARRRTGVALCQPDARVQKPERIALGAVPAAALSGRVVVQQACAPRGVAGSGGIAGRELQCDLLHRQRQVQAAMLFAQSGILSVLQGLQRKVHISQVRLQPRLVAQGDQLRLDRAENFLERTADLDQGRRLVEVAALHRDLGIQQCRQASHVALLTQSQPLRVAMYATAETLGRIQLAEFDVDQAVQEVTPGGQVGRVCAMSVLVRSDSGFAAALEVAQREIAVAQAVGQRGDQEGLGRWHLGEQRRGARHAILDVVGAGLGGGLHVVRPQQPFLALRA